MWIFRLSKISFFSLLSIQQFVKIAFCGEDKMKLQSHEKLRKPHRAEKNLNGSCFEQGPFSDSLWSILFISRPFRKTSPEIISDDSRRLQKENQRLQSLQFRVWIRKFNLLNYFPKEVNNRWTFSVEFKSDSNSSNLIHENKSS